MKSEVIYYPFFVPRYNDWLASSLLWWEKLHLIWPRGISTSDPLVNEFMKSGIVQPIDPT